MSSFTSRSWRLKWNSFASRSWRLKCSFASRSWRQRMASTSSSSQTQHDSSSSEIGETATYSANSTPAQPGQIQFNRVIKVKSNSTEWSFQLGTWRSTVRYGYGKTITRMKGLRRARRWGRGAGGSEFAAAAAHGFSPWIPRKLGFPRGPGGGESRGVGRDGDVGLALVLSIRASKKYQPTTIIFPIEIISFY